MLCVNIDEVERNLSAYLKRVEAGETIVVARDNRPVVELRPIKSEHILPRLSGYVQENFVFPMISMPLCQNLLSMNLRENENFAGHLYFSVVYQW
ncbi:MAG: hypothetical protein SCARUB_02233 [Candidatus Scalindua rubra]|uniref:Uncharacterized protein n=1 Tax=Candidatus Scalindua rubra TaxID=1872076 RepID=A0A1E3XAI6_9BACT|nr:MAG: hypothetical protein SCARUB_02233 [Candidatus Scalindua rubra]